MGMAYVSFEMGANSVVPLHYHPRGSELHLVLQGSVTVGIVDSTNKLFIQTLQAADMFVFPKGMVYFQINEDTYKPALAMSALSSSNPGIVMLPPTLFHSGIDDLVLQNSFKITPQSLAQLKAPFNKD
ncbi:hypothetical protein KI387_002718 [Taxus chinensis]|uniref:Germin-like protein n=1 Tax=Taxus chinensis TaxID=29808 RepID=A0AA38GZW8_TAXCH|nr:hypothetical protein KI387_002718 [Taxus chinensis]